MIIPLETTLFQKFCTPSHGKSLSPSILAQDLRERADLSKLNKELGWFSEQDKSSEIRGGLLLSATALINAVLNIRSKSQELNENLNQLAETHVGGNEG